MTLRIEAAAAEDAPAIAAFNHRLRQAGVEFQFPDSPASLATLRREGASVWHEIFVAKDNVAVRGGYLLKRELLFTNRDALEIGNYQLPLSEGVADRKHAMVGIRMLQDVMRRRSSLYCLGMGSLERPLPRLLARSSWSVEPVPFLFRVVRASGFLANISYLKQRRHGGLSAALARYSGLGTLAVWSWGLATRMRAPRRPNGLSVESVNCFGAEADTVFVDNKDAYGALIERTAAALNIRFPAGDERLIRLVVRSHGKPSGWLVLTRTDLRNHKQFGSMRLGCIVDGLCAPGLCTALVGIGTECLISEDVDLIVSNQAHLAWLGALRRCGYIAGPSNFIFARSPELGAATPALAEWHLNRGDGDGPINL